MAVYPTTYRRYEGETTARWSRFLVLPRYALGQVFSSKLLTGFFALCFVAPLFAAVLIYLHHNAGALEMFGINPSDLLAIDTSFFYWFLVGQGFMAFLVTALVGPSLVSPDLAHNALPLYLCRPFSRSEYILGKMSVLAILLSLITWVPGLLLFGLQVHLEGSGWLGENLRIGVAIFVGTWVWIVCLSLLALSVSAWVRWRTVAAGSLFAFFFIAAALSGIINKMFETRWGALVHVGMMIRVVWEGLFYGRSSPEGIPVWSAWTALAAISLFFLAILYRKLRAYEVVK